MRQLVDAEGRFMGKFRLIDAILALLVALSVVTVYTVFIGGPRYAALAAPTPRVFEDANISLLLESAKPWVVAALPVGFAHTDGDISVTVLASRPRADGQELDLRLRVERRNDEWYFRDVPIKINMALVIPTPRIDIRGVITGV